MHNFFVMHTLAPPPRNPPQSVNPSARTLLVARRLAKGRTLREIGAELGVSRQRVHQIVVAAGLENRIYDLRRAAREKRQREDEARREARKASKRAAIDRGLALIGSGRSVLSAERDLGLRRGSLGRVVRARGIKSQHGPNRPDRLPAPGTIRHTIMTLADGTRTVAEIAAAVSKSIAHVR